MQIRINRLARFLIIFSVLAMVLFLTACSSGNGTTKTITTTSSASSGNSVNISNYAFSPVTITVNAGTSVTWTNKDSVTHTITSDTGVFTSGNIAINATYTYKFNTAGTYPYHCSIHPTMKGTVIVR